MWATLLLSLCAAPQAEMNWHPATELGLEGQGWQDTKLPFDRLPRHAEGMVRDAVWNLSRQSSGLALRFTSDARDISARWELADGALSLPHMPASGKSGLDLYTWVDGQWKWLAATKPSSTKQEVRLARNLPAGTRDYLLYLPLYHQTLDLKIGFNSGAFARPTEQEGMAASARPNRRLPILFYGTSITHGASASRPGMTHPAILGRRLDHSVINLGFSGNGRMEIELAELLGEVDTSVYVLDCLPNMNANMVTERAAPFVRRLREIRPGVPIVLVEDRINTNAHLNPGRAQHHAMNRRALRQAYEQLLREGVDRLHYIRGAELLGDDTLATVDSSHPTDLGFMRMADIFEPVLRRALRSTRQAASPFGATPSPAQLRWHDMQYYAFVHFNMNTFTDIEWGHGTESPQTFAPTELDARQWCRIFKDAGMKAVILTAKHHDGFCLWPSAYTEHDVANSPWKDGYGDVLREVSEACTEYGLRFGVYLSPWDRNHPLYGSGEPYNQAFAGQLEEVLSDYGAVFEVWFDGANGEGPNGKKQVYDWDLFHETVFKFQPEAIIFSDSGPGCRWVGNEAGYAGETNWATLNVADYGPGTPKYRELTKGNRGGTHWVPAEADVSIRPGWYYHAEQDDKVKTPEHLLDIWYGSIGRGANLLLNIPVDRRGLVHENDEAALRTLRQTTQRTLQTDLLSVVPAQAIEGQQNLSDWGNLFDQRARSYWRAGEDNRVGLVFGEAQVFDHIMLQEAIEFGQRIAAFRVEADGQEVARGTTIGAQRILRFDAVRASCLEVIIEEADATPVLASLQLYNAPSSVELVQGQLEFIGEQDVEVRALGDRFAEVRYSLDGSEVTRESALAKGPIRIDSATRLRARAFDAGVPGLNELDLQFEQLDMKDLRSAVQFIRPPDAGLNVDIFEMGWQTLDQMREATPTSQNHCLRPTLDALTREENIGAAFTGWIQVPADGIYEFTLISDDGSRWYCGEELLIDHDGLHGAEPRSGRIGLQAGWHPVRIEYFNARGGRSLAVHWAGPKVESGPIPDSAWGH